MLASTRIALPLLIALVPAAAFAADAAPARSAPAQAVGPQYEAGAFHRWLWGTDYRALWTTPVRVEVLDLGTLRRRASRRSRGSAGARRRASPCAARTDATTPSARSTRTRRASCPRSCGHLGARPRPGPDRRQPARAPFLVVDELMDAAGILRADAAARGDAGRPAARRVPAGVRRRGRSDLRVPARALRARIPASRAPSRSSSTQDFYARMAAGSADRARRAGLPEGAALRPHDRRLGSPPRPVALGASFEGRPGWQPIPDDRDQAFSRYEGLVLGLARRARPVPPELRRRVSGHEGPDLERPGAGPPAPGRARAAGLRRWPRPSCRSQITRRR